MRIAHISDIHVPSKEPIPWHQLANKRFTGMVNLRTFRKEAHPFALCQQLLDDVREEGCDHIVLTGDLTNLSSETEFALAKEALSPLASEGKLTVIPGNHDQYISSTIRQHRFESFFADLMGTTSANSPPNYPFLKQVENIAIAGINSAIATPAFTSYGHVDQAQRERLANLFNDSSLQDTYKIVLIHHNLHPRHSRLKDWMSGLRERDLLIASLFEANVDLVLHGHTHKAHRMRLESEGRTITVIGCGSSTWAHSQHPARYNIYTIEAGCLQRIDCKVFNPADRQFTKLEQPLPLP